MSLTPPAHAPPLSNSACDHPDGWNLSTSPNINVDHPTPSLVLQFCMAHHQLIL